MKDDKLNERLAEWAGFEEADIKKHYYYEIGGERKPKWLEPNTDYHIKLPKFTQSLDICYKWLVPQTLEILITRGYVPPIMKLFQLWYDELVSLTGDSSNTQQVALALSLAIDKLIKEEK